MNTDSVNFIAGYLTDTSEPGQCPAFGLNSMPSSLIGCDPRKLPIKIGKAKSSDGTDIGLGIFATKEIPADTFVTFYPIHLSYKLFKDGSMAKAYDHSMYSKDPFDDFKYFDSINTQYRILVGDFGEYEQYDIGDPQFIDSTKKLHLVGNLVNDAYPNILEITEPTEDEDKIIHDWIQYEIRTNSRANCSYVQLGRLWAIKTIKQIQPEEELCCKYGYQYWSRPGKSHEYLNSLVQKNIDKNPLVKRFLEDKNVKISQ